MMSVKQFVKTSETSIKKKAIFYIYLLAMRKAYDISYKIYSRVSRIPGLALKSTVKIIFISKLHLGVNFTLGNSR